MITNSSTILRSLVVAVFVLTTFHVNAQRHFNGRGERWHGGNIHRFEIHDRAYWRGGYWRHQRYGGRLGWWWVVGPSWYYYSRPIYPYPDPYLPSVLIMPTQPQTPQTTPPVQYWYYCEQSKDYYPYVSECPAGWKAVPVSPSSATAPK